MKKWLMAVLLGTVLVLGACGGGGDTSEPDTGADDTTDTEEATDDGDATVDVAAAEDAYKQSCASCHGDDLSGGVGPELDAVGASLSADEIETIILDGVGTMPGGLLGGDEATAVAQWLAEMK